jgi:integrase
MSKSKVIDVLEDQTKKKLGVAFYYINLRSLGIKLATDKRGKKRMYFETYEEAYNKAQELNNQQRNGGVISAHPERSVGAAIDLFCENTDHREQAGKISWGYRRGLIDAATGGDKDPRTEQYPLGGWKAFEVDGTSFSQIPVVDVDVDLIERLINQNLAHHADKTIVNKLEPLKLVFDLAQRKKWCSENPARLVKLEPTKYQGEQAAEENTLEVIKVDHIRSLIRTALDEHEGVDGLAIAFACQAGLRFGEMAALKWKHIDFDRSRVHVNLAMRKQRGRMVAADIPKKTKKGDNSKARRVVFLLPSLVNDLKQWYLKTAYSGADDYVFCKPDGSHQKSADHWRVQVLHKICGKVDGLAQLRFHDLRHVFASLCLMQLGKDLVRVSDLLGHQTVEITRSKYGHWIDDPDRDRSDAEKLEAALWGAP